MTSLRSLAAGGAGLAMVSALAAATPAYGTFQGGLTTYVDQTKLTHYEYARSLAVDVRGGLHEVGSDGSGRAPLYATRQPGAHDFIYRFVADQGVDGIEATLVAPTVDGKSIDAVASQCSSVRAIRVSRLATRLTFGENDQVTTENRCNAGQDDDDIRPDLVGFTPMAHDRMAVLFLGDPRHARHPGSPVVLIGRPGGHFRATRLPMSSLHSNNFVITRDPVNGRVIVAGQGDYDASLGGIPLDVWSLNWDRAMWSNPDQAAVLPIADPTGTASYDLTSVVASHRQIWVGYLSIPVWRKQRSQAYVAHRLASGKWDRPSKVGPGNVKGEQLQLVASPGAKVQVFEFDNAAKTHGKQTGNLEARVLRKGGFAAPTRITGVSGGAFYWTAAADWHHRYDYAYSENPT